MELSNIQLLNIQSKIFAHISRELKIANKNGMIAEMLDKYGIILEEEYMPIEVNRSKIIVFGALAGKVYEYQAIAKEYGISSDHIEFQNDYAKLTNFDVGRFRNCSNYTDIIYGPVPHSTSGKGDASSILAEMKNNPQEFPRVIEALANGKLKITKNSFINSLIKTRYYEKIVLEE